MIKLLVAAMVLVTTVADAQTTTLCTDPAPTTMPTGVPVQVAICVQKPNWMSYAKIVVNGTMLWQGRVYEVTSSSADYREYMVPPLIFPAATSQIEVYAGAGSDAWSPALTLYVNTQSPPPPSECTATLGEPSASTFTYTVNTGTVPVTTSTPDCAWSVSTTNSWLNVNKQSGVGAMALTFILTENGSEQSRQAQLKVNSSIITIMQLGKPAAPSPCVYVITIDQQQFSRAGGDTTLAVGTTPPCPWSILDDADWLRYTRISGAGSGTITMTVRRFNGRGSRTANVSIGGYVFQIQQAGR